MKYRIALPLILAAAIFGGLFFFLNPKPGVYIVGDPESVPGVPQPDGRTFYDVKVSGYVTHWKGDVYLVIMPIDSAHSPSHWWVQQPVVFLDSVNNAERHWVGHADFYTRAVDVPQDFKLFALATSNRYPQNQGLPAEPDGFKSSAKVVSRLR